MRKIIVTEENIKYVKGLVRKFFCTNKPHNFESYHNFGSGWKEEIPFSISKKDWPRVQKNWRNPDLYCGKDKYIGYRTPISIEIDKHDTSWNKGSFIRVKYPKKDGFKTYPTVISVGDTISFNRGNYLVIKSKWNATDVGKYIYRYVRRIEAN